ncbi:zinc finger protein-like protein zpr1 [Aulographum hederae CBS 113979]|uniref:Zinc finger protein-like protein zpr1 n=1 Tax=Aulographum hederae CBS 113979 TaxID=1176131 RepID=A0A6G1GK29_9PEZI|nr:zinc finger protein-like protein zpr1 [Aulographum hederae CBS 113979]
MAPPKSLAAQDLFQDMGQQVERASGVADVQDGQDEGESQVVDNIESMCMNCHENGFTKFLLTRIPFFRQIIISSFYCEHCGFKNSEVQPAGEIQQRGVKYTFKLDNAGDLARQVVKSDTCSLRIEEIDLEIPPGRGQLTNVEGITAMIAQDLAVKQDERKTAVPEVYEKIEEIIQTLRTMAAGNKIPFTISVDDPAGNSWIEPSTTDRSGKYTRHEYARTPEQNANLGLGEVAEETPASAEADADGAVEMRPEYQQHGMVPALPSAGVANVDSGDDIIENQVYSFPASCPGCTHPCTTNMKMVNIPHFKQVVLMSTVCEDCGYRSNEVKTGGEVPELGRRITIKVAGTDDLSRDILKSESCALHCPELSLQVEPGTLGGRFTTIEGLLTQVRDDLHSSIFDMNEEKPSSGGDSMPQQEKAKWEAFFGQLDQAIKGELPFTAILEDPLAASYVQSMNDDGKPDDAMKVEEYERTEEEEEDLGLRDMKVEGYEEGGGGTGFGHTPAPKVDDSPKVDKPKEVSADEQAERQMEVNEG